MEWIIEHWKLIAVIIGSGGLFSMKVFRHALLRFVKIGIKVLLTEEMAMEYILDLARWLTRKTPTDKDDKLVDLIAKEVAKEKADK